MKVAILYSGGKDSTFAIDHALEKGWEIAYLLSVKPTRTDCFLFHYATVEHTPTLAKILGIRHILTSCDVADPKKEAEIVKNIVAKEEKVDAVVLGGTGLQETQLRSIQETLMPLGIDVFAAHAGQDHDTVMQEMIAKGYDIRMTQFAAEGLSAEWLGRRIDEKSFPELKKLADKFGFHIGAEGGHWDSLVLDGPIFPKRLEVTEAEKVIDDKYCGHLVIKRLNAVEKPVLVDTSDVLSS